MNAVVLAFCSLLLVSRVESQRRRTLAENDPCGEGQNVGICKKAEDCSVVSEILKKGGRPEVCGFKGRSPVICCPHSLNQRPNQQPVRPLNTNSVHKSISARKCEEYSKYVVESINVLGIPGAPDENVTHCAWSAQELIVGGEKANPKVFLHMALIGYSEAKEWFCGGSLVSHRFVLSAAHCYEVYSMKAGWVRLGELDLASNEDEASPIDIRIVDHFVHPNYNKEMSYHDIALFKLASDVKFTPYIRPICLHNSYDVDTRFRPIVTGWGHTSYKGEFSNDLMQLHVDIVDTNKCKKTFKRFESNKKSLIPRGIDGELMLCAGGEEGKDSCSGDSGGPLQVPLTKPFCMFNQIGIVSFGNRCAVGDPGVYTRISTYIDWIESIVWSES